MEPTPGWESERLIITPAVLFDDITKGSAHILNGGYGRTVRREGWNIPGSRWQSVFCVSRPTDYVLTVALCTFTLVSRRGPSS